MKKLLILLSAILLIASTFALGIFADPYDEVQLPGLPEGVQGYEIEGASNEMYADLFEVTKKYFVVSMTLPFAEKVGGTLSDNGCVGLTIGDENYECFYIPHDVVDYHNGTSSPGFSEDPRAQIRVGQWWGTSAFGAMQINYIDGQEGSITEDTLVGQDITIYVEGKIELEDEAYEAWKVTIKAWINDTPLVLNGGEMEVTAYDFENNPYVGYGCKLTGVTAQIKFAQSNKEIDRSVLVNGVPDDTGMPGPDDYECHHFYSKIKSDRDVHWKECDRCGEKYSIEMHTFEDGVCTICGEEEVLYGDANGDGKIDSKDIILLKKYIANLENGKSSVTLGHKVEVDPGYPATCTEDGMTDGKKCTDCGKVLASKEIIPAYGHNVDKWTVTKQPNCTEDGESQGTCTRCGKTDTLTIASAGGHSFGQWSTTKEATCTEDGEREHTCANCGGNEIKTIKAGGHSFGEWNTTKEATCTKNGERERTCGLCGEKDVEAITASGHTKIKMIIDIEPAVTEKGSGHTKCISCGNTIQANITIDAIADQLLYTLNSSSKTCTITGCKSSNVSIITIPESIDGYTVTAIGDKAFADCTQLTEITIPSTVKTIGTRAFYGCTGITEITIPESVTSIGTQIFYKATNLTTVNYYSSYYSSDNAVLSTGSISKVVFKSLSNAQSILKQCPNIKEVVLADGITSIGYKAFYYYANLASITIPDSVTRIDEDAFYNCTSLTSITIPDSVTSIGEDAFYNCKNLKAVYYTGDIESWLHISFDCSDGDYPYSNPLHGGASLYFGGKLVTDVVVPDTIAKINDCAFSGYKSLTSITIPDSVTSIGMYAFYDCTNLKTVNYTGDIESWLKISFDDCHANPCYNSTSLYFGGKLVTDVVVPDTIAKINDCAFCGCTSLVSITIPDSVTSISNYAFIGCTSLTSITIPDSVTSIGVSAFRGCTSLTSITIPESVTSIGGYAFYNCTSLTSITIPDSVTSIGYSAFRGCTSLTSIVIPDSVTSIGGYAFYNCTSLTSITIPDSVTSIGEDAFYNCKNLGKVYYGGTADQWSSISISIDSYNKGNYNLTGATRYYYSETEPTESGNYWHYVDGVVTEW